MGSLIAITRLGPGMYEASILKPGKPGLDLLDSLCDLGQDVQPL